MNRPTLTVTDVSGHHYDANHLAVTIRSGKPVLSFECSGGIRTMEMHEIGCVTFTKSGGVWCPWCDSSIEKLHIPSGKTST